MPIFGALKCKTTRKSPGRVTFLTVPDLLEGILEQHVDNTLAAESVHMNKIRYRCIHFGTTKLVKDKKEATIMTSINQVVQAYNAQLIKVRNVLGNRQFEHNCKAVAGTGTCVCFPEGERRMKFLNPRNVHGYE